MLRRLTRLGRAMLGAPWKRWQAALPLAMALVVMGGTVALAATVNYGTPNAAVTGALITPMENLAATIKNVLFVLALLVIVIGVVLRMMAHNPQLQMTGTRAITISIEGILVLLFLPLVLNALAGFNIPVL